MLSLGRHHERVPREPIANLKFRRNLLRSCADSPSRQRTVLRACEEDLVFWINSFAFSYNPKLAGREVGPFILWPFQEEALRVTLNRLWVDQKPILWEKSRELGATWLALLLKDWASLFHPWKKFLAVSHSEMAVDRAGDPDSLFWKLDFVHQHLPDWMLRGVIRRKMGFAYPATHSSFNGAASTERSGVGGRATSVLLDELGKQTAAREIVGQTADTGPQLFISTHYGVGTTFFELSRRPDLHKIVMHWSQHPEKRRGLYRYDADSNKVEILDKTYVYPADFKFVMDGTPAGGPYPGVRSPWYDEECKQRDERDVCMHLDIDPQGSARQYFNPLLIHQLIRETARPPYWTGELDYDPDLALPQGLSPEKGGRLLLWIHPINDQPPLGDYTVGVDCAEGTGATPSCVSVFCKGTGEKAAEYTDPHIEPHELAAFVVALCRLFADVEGRGTRLAWEIPGPGMTFGKNILRLGYGNIYYREPNPILQGGKLAEIPGWVCNNQSKSLLLRDYKKALRDRRYINRSEKALDECLAFQWDAAGNIVHGGEQSIVDPSGARVNHGDRVIADALSWKMAQESARVGAVPPETAIPVNSLAWRRQQRVTVSEGAGW